MTSRTRTGRRALALPASAAVFAMVMLSACTDNSPGTPAPGASADARALTVNATDTACTLSASTAPAGKLRFSVTNAGSKPNEFYLMAEDGAKVVGEVEDIGPGVTRDLVVTVVAGRYLSACKPGMSGDGIKASFVVTTAGESGEEATPSGAEGLLVKAASTQYASYLRKESARLLTSTQTFVRLYVAGSADAARALYPRAHQHWERIEPITEGFKELGRSIDGREADVVDVSTWTGWHRIEKDLWPESAVGYTTLNRSMRKRLGVALLADTQELIRQTRTTSYSADQIIDNARRHVDGLATDKVTGAEEVWSRTDLWDLQADIDGARAAIDSLRPLLNVKQPALAVEISQRLTELQRAVDRHRQGNGFRAYGDLSTREVKELSDRVNAASEPISEMGTAVV